MIASASRRTVSISCGMTISSTKTTSATTNAPESSRLTGRSQRVPGLHRGLPFLRGRVNARSISSMGTLSTNATARPIRNGEARFST